MKKVITILLMFAFIINIQAYENNIFEIDIPDSYKETINEEYVYKWEKDNDYIAITISSNEKAKYNVKSYTKEDIIKQKEYIETNINKGLEKYEIKATVSDINKYNINDLYYIEYSIHYPTKNTTGYDIYQKGRMYTTNNYITTIIFNSDKEIKEKEFNDIVNTLNIKDNHIVLRDTNKDKITISTIIVGILLAIVVLLIKYKRRL